MHVDTIFNKCCNCRSFRILLVIGCIREGIITGPYLIMNETGPQIHGNPVGLEWYHLL